MYFMLSRSLYEEQLEEHGLVLAIEAAHMAAISRKQTFLPPQVA
jgi:hypothetical protein